MSHVSSWATLYVIVLVQMIKGKYYMNISFSESGHGKECFLNF